ncbi:uncharacterized protein [Rhodnius prolixus]
MEGWTTDPEESTEPVLCFTPKNSHLDSPINSADTTPGSPANLLWNFSIPEVDQKIKDAASELASGIRERRRKRRRLLNSSPTISYLKRKFSPSILNVTSLSDSLHKMEKSTDSDESVETDQSKEKETNPDDKTEDPSTNSASILDDGDDDIFLEINT